jgi:hypothetical protein
MDSEVVILALKLNVSSAIDGTLIFHPTYWRCAKSLIFVWYVMEVLYYKECFKLCYALYNLVFQKLLLILTAAVTFFVASKKYVCYCIRVILCIHLHQCSSVITPARMNKSQDAPGKIS